MSELLIQQSTLQDIANAVRAKKGTTDPIPVNALATEIASIQTSGESVNKLALLVGPQSADIPYDITAEDLGNIPSICPNAFSNKLGLRNISIPNSVTSIGIYALYGCDSLTSVTIGNNVKSIGEYAFYQCSSLTSVTIPDSVTSIEEHTFNSCTKLTSVTIGNGVLSIGDSAFWRCTGLTSITIPNSVTSIGNGAFDSCSSLADVIIGNGVADIADYAFQGTAIKTLTLKPTVPPNLRSSNVFTITNLQQITVPKGTLTAYQTATNWSSLASYMVEAAE